MGEGLLRRAEGGGVGTQPERCGGTEAAGAARGALRVGRGPAAAGVRRAPAARGAVPVQVDAVRALTAARAQSPRLRAADGAYGRSAAPRHGPMGAQRRAAPSACSASGTSRRSRGGGRSRGPGCVRSPEPGKAVPLLFSPRTGGRNRCSGRTAALCGSLPAASPRSPATSGRSAGGKRAVPPSGDGTGRIPPLAFGVSPGGGAQPCPDPRAAQPPRPDPRVPSRPRGAAGAASPRGAADALRGRPRGLLSRRSASSPVGRANTTWPSVPQRCRKRGDTAAPGWPRCGRRKTRSDGNCGGDGQEEQHGCAGGAAGPEPAGPGLASRCPGQEEERSIAADRSGSGHAPLASRQQQLPHCAQQKDGFRWGGGNRVPVRFRAYPRRTAPFSGAVGGGAGMQRPRALRFAVREGQEGSVPAAQPAVGPSGHGVRSAGADPPLPPRAERWAPLCRQK